MTDKKLKVLYVDDDTFLLDMYGVKFSKNNFEIQTATNAGEALKKLRDKIFEPDIILIDIVMPGMDGLTLLETIRKEKLADDAIAIMLTNQGGSSEIDRSKELGAVGYVVKATSIPTEVVAKVKKIYETVKNK